MSEESRVPLTEEQRELAGRGASVRLALRVAGWYCRGRRVRDREAVESAALLGLVEAARGFDPSGPSDFAGFAVGRIKGAIKDAYRMTLPLGFRRSAAVPVVVSLSGGVGDLIVDGWEFESEWLAEVVWLAVRMERELGEALLAYFGCAGVGCSVVRLARHLGVAQSTASERLARALEKARRLVTRRVYEDVREVWGQADDAEVGPASGG